MKSSLSLNGSEFPVTPVGLAGVRLITERESDRVYFRRKASGTLTFIKDDFNRVKPLQDCCNNSNLSIFRDCDQTKPFLTVTIPAQKTEWNFQKCEAKVNELTISDLYTGVYELWEKKINVLKLTANLSIYHTVYVKNPDKPDTDRERNGEQTIVLNNRFRTFNSVLLYIIQQTFTGTKYELLIPSMTQMSQFLTDTTNPVDNSPNLFLRSGIGHASDVMEPTNKQSATGLLDNGTDNESMAISLKDILDDLYALADVDWLIDPATNKIRIEHRLFFVNGNTYTTPAIKLDLTSAQYAKHVSSYRGSYKLDSENLFGIEELYIDGNQTLMNSKYAYPLPLPINQGGGTYFIFPKMNDFEFGNIRYDSPCATRDDKGLLTKQTRNCKLFYTCLDPIQFGDPAVDQTSKWFLVEYVVKEIKIPFVNITVKSNSFARSVVERVNISALNGNFSATTLMRKFHRHNRSFSRGLMNYNDAVAKQKGFYRPMYSVRPSKVPEKVTIPYCCSDAEIDPYALIKLPDGSLGQLTRSEFSFATSTIELEVRSQSSCGGAILPMPVDEGNVTLDPITGQPIENPIDPTTGDPVNGNKPYGELIRTVTIQVRCDYWIDYPGGNYRTEMVDAERNYYADGAGGEYFIDDQPCLI